MSTETTKKNSSARARMQAFGGFLTAMVIPNMGAFIAWGFITALFISSGWIPNKNYAELVSPMSHYLLPVLIAFMGGKLVHGDRGGVIGTVATFGLIVGSKIPMFLGAMIMGPLSAWLLKKFDQLIEDHMPAGFEMVINNFSLGFLALALCLVSYSFVGPAIEALNGLLTAAVNAIVKTGALPLLAILNEPAKVLFLNNVIDQGIYYPLGMQQALAHGKSIFFMVASNPGAGLGLLLAYSLFGKGQAKDTAPGAIIVHFFGGIHEMYFPYVLMKPITLIGMIAGSASGIVTFSAFHVGLVAGPSPGSIFSYLALTPRGNFGGVLAGVGVAALVSFLINSIFIRNSKETSDEELAAAQQSTASMKQEGKDVLNSAVAADDSKADAAAAESADAAPINKIAFACDAGMGSSAMGATSFRKKVKDAGYQIEVKHYAIEKVPDDADLIVTHENLGDRARSANPNKRVVTIKNFMQDPALDKLLEEIKKRNPQ